MSNPEEQSAAQSTAQVPEPTFEQKVGEVVKQFTKDESGKTVLPEGLEVDEPVRYAAMAEKRRRDTESALGKTTQKLRAEEATRKELEKRVAGQTVISPEDQQVLNELKFSDPEAWRIQMNAIEQKATTSLHEELSTISSNASQQAEFDRRVGVLAQFNLDNPDYPVTDEAIINDIPPRITKKLDKGEISFEDFLLEANKYLATPKKIAGTEVQEQPNLGSLGGGSTPSRKALDTEAVESYENQTF